MGVHTRWRENPPYFGCWPHTFEFRLAYHYPDIRLGCRLIYCIKSELQLDVSGDKWPFSVVFWLLSSFRPYALIIQIKSLYRTFLRHWLFSTVFGHFGLFLTAYADILVRSFVSRDQIGRRINLLHQIKVSINSFFFLFFCEKRQFLAILNLSLNADLIRTYFHLETLHLD